MTSRIIAPRVATIIDHMNPPLPRPSRFCVMKPPTKAPAIPSRIVTIIPPGSSPGMISLPSPPAMSPIIIQAMMPIILGIPPSLLPYGFALDRGSPTTTSAAHPHVLRIAGESACEREQQYQEIPNTNYPYCRVFLPSKAYGPSLRVNSSLYQLLTRPVNLAHVYQLCSLLFSSLTLRSRG